MFKQFHAPVAFGAGAILMVTLGAGANQLTAATPSPNTPLEARVAKLEQQLRNVAMLVDLDLSNDKAVYLHKMKKNATLTASTTRTIQTQMQLFALQHHGRYPNVVQNWHLLTKSTDADGRYKKNGLGPYLNEAPINDLTNSSTVVDNVQKVDAKTGWHFDSKTATLRAAAPRSLFEELQLNANEFVPFDPQ